MIDVSDQGTRDAKIRDIDERLCSIIYAMANERRKYDRGELISDIMDIGGYNNEIPNDVKLTAQINDIMGVLFTQTNNGVVLCRRAGVEPPQYPDD